MRTEAAGRFRAFGLLEVLVLDSGTKSHFEVLVDDMLVVADLEVLDDVLEDRLARAFWISSLYLG